MNRVVVTGMNGLCSLGQDWTSIYNAFKNKKSGVRRMHEWQTYEGLNSRIASAIDDFVLPEHYDRKKIRTMGRVSLLATVATERALIQAGLLGSDILKSGQTGVAYGSSSGSTPAIEHFAGMRIYKTIKGLTPVSYTQMMSHTCVANLELFFGIKGRLIPSSSACVSGSLGIGYAYESIKHGYQTVMIAGGGEELCPTQVAVFDIMFAASTKNDTPTLTPRPFDKNRDGLVVGEGACTLILEERSHALARGAHIYAEIIGFGTNSDGLHMTSPSPQGMQTAMHLALQDAGLSAQDMGYVNAHATATERGDIAESEATYAVFKHQVPVSSLKGYMGHTLGASGALESWLSIEMMNHNYFAPTLNLEQIDERCAPLDYIMHDGRILNTEFVMNNNFAFGGMNTSLIFKRV